MNSASSEQQGKKRPVQVTFDQAVTQYASQVLVQASPEELFLNFSAGVLPAKEPAQFIMPVHTRIALNYFAAKRLLQSLQQVMAQYEQAFGAINLAKGQQATTNSVAGFPKLNYD